MNSDRPYGKSFFFAFALLISLQGFSQPKNVIRVLSKIKDVPSWYKKDFYVNGMKRFSKDSTYNVVCKMDSFAIIRLMDVLSDTSKTEITNSCTDTKLTYGQLAFMLINDIEHVPIGSVTNIQWCVWGDCGIVPDGLWDYLKTNATAFEESYREYFISTERIVYLNSIRSKKENQSEEK